MSKSGREIELKLEVDPTALAALKRVGRIDGFIAGKAATKTLQSVYFDTDDQALRSARISLRVRKVGRRWLQTAKLGTGVLGGVSSAIEAEHAVEGRALDFTVIADDSVRITLEDAIGDAPLAERFETVMKRTTRMLARAADGAEIEMAFDHGNVLAAGTTVPLAELEMELKAGPSQSLFDAAKAVLGSTPFRFSPCSKAERGYRLAEGRQDAPGAPRFAGKTRFDEDETVERAFRDILRSCLDQIADNRMAVLKSHAPEGPHQLRVGLRRLRSALRLFRPALNPATRTALDCLARDLAAEAGALRDLDVLINDIIAPLTEVAPEGIRFDGLTSHLEGTREKVRSNLEAHLRSSEVNAFILDLAAYTEGRGWLDPEDLDQTTILAQPLREFAAIALAKQWKKVSRYGKRIDELSIPERHEMRKALKKLRYGVEFFGSLYPVDTVKPFLKRLKKLQDIFGYLNDVAMAEKLPHLNGLSGDSGMAAAEGTGFVIGWHEAQSRAMWQHAKGFWQETRETPRFWI